MTQSKAIQSIRFLGIDAINKANSGHPGVVLGAAPMIYTLFTRHMNIDVRKPNWENRDRFVLSVGHGSMLLYAINHLIGYKISMNDIKNFRQLGNTPGHPEYGHTEGVETTSGPLGQGIANAVGMAISETHLGSKFNTDKHKIVDHYTYVLCGDGDLQEGVAMEAMSLAGHLGLEKLIVLFDSNDIQLDGDLNLAFSENHEEKFKAIGWNYLQVEDGNDVEAIDKAILQAKDQKDKPTIIEVKTIIGYGSSNEGTSKVHGAPLGFEEAEKLRRYFNWEYEPFVIPRDVYDHFEKLATRRGINKRKQWLKTFKTYSEENIEKAKQYDLFFNQEFKLDLNKTAKIDFKENDATRNVSGQIIDKVSEQHLNLIGGSADLTASTKAKGSDGHFSKYNRAGRNINFGVREHAMGAIVNGITLHGGLKAFGGGFFVFSDYMKPALRLSAIMQIPSIFVFTHDSIAVGEDGPTHQPVEQLTGLRAIPNFNVIRPADARETIAAWSIALESKNTPTSIVLTRQNVFNGYDTKIGEVSKGAYIVSKEKEELDGIIITCGSELELAMAAKDDLYQKGIDVRVVSMPSQFLFEKQTQKYKKEILPKRAKIVAIEMASSMSWYKYTQNVIGLDVFGASAPASSVIEHCKFDKKSIIEKISKILK